MEFKDYYRIMGVARHATLDEIKRSYRKLARKYHPDVSKEPDAQSRFREINEAYEVLKDPQKRAAYDQLGTNWKAGQQFSPPPGWDQGFEFRGGGFTGVDAEHFSDFFESLFGRSGFGRNVGRQARREFHARGEDSHARILIDIKDAYQGATRSIRLRQTEVGTDGRPQFRERQLNVRIPRGVHQKQHIRLAKQGGAGTGHGDAGDLYLEVGFAPDPLYRVDGKNVFFDLPVAPWEAALGATIRAPTPTGPVELRIPPNSVSGQKLRLKGRGIPAKQAGDLYIVIQVALPRVNSAAEQAAYTDFARAFRFNPRAGLGV